MEYKTALHLLIRSIFFVMASYSFMLSTNCTLSILVISLSSAANFPTHKNLGFILIVVYVMGNL